MNKLIRVLILLVCNQLLMQCDNSPKYEILFHRENPYFSFLITDEKEIFYGAPYNAEKPIPLKSNKKLVFEDYQKQFNIYSLS